MYHKGFTIAIIVHTGYMCMNWLSHWEEEEIVVEWAPIGEMASDWETIVLDRFNRQNWVILARTGSYHNPNQAICVKILV